MVRSDLRQAAASILKNSLGLARRAAAGYADRRGKGIVRLAPEGRPRGRALIARRLDGFLQPDAQHLRRHNQYSEAVAMAETLVERGFAVDVIAHRRRTVPQGRRYDLLIASRVTFDALAAGVGPDCVKIGYLDMMHWTANNHASLGRTLEVQRTRGITPERTILAEANRAIETADCGILFGNRIAWETYAFAGKPIFQIPNPGIRAFPPPEDKDFAACRRRFLWLGSRGLAHKGLGRVLEAFARMPEMELTVCGPLESEPLFAQAYRRELEETPNIHALGWIDLADPAFAALSDSTLGMIFPSCAEAQAGAVVNAMHAGLVPLVSREATIDVDPFGVLLPDSSVETIMAEVRALSRQPPDRLATRAQAAWATARRVHTRERYKAVLGAIIERVMAERRRLPAGFILMDDPDTARPDTSCPDLALARQAGAG